MPKLPPATDATPEGLVRALARHGPSGGLLPWVHHHEARKMVQITKDALHLLKFLPLWIRQTDFDADAYVRDGDAEFGVGELGCAGQSGGRQRPGTSIWSATSRSTARSRPVRSRYDASLILESVGAGCEPWRSDG